MKYIFIDAFYDRDDESEAAHFDQALKELRHMLEEAQRLSTSTVNENVQSQPRNLTKALKEAEEKFKADAEIALKQHDSESMP